MGAPVGVGASRACGGGKYEWHFFCYFCIIVHYSPEEFSRFLQELKISSPAFLNQYRLGLLVMVNLSFAQQGGVMLYLCQLTVLFLAHLQKLP